MNIVCLASGRGSNVEALIRAIREQPIDAAVVLVISNNSGAEVLNIARAAAIPSLHLSEKPFPDHAAFARRMVDVLQQVRADLIVLAGYMRKLPDDVCRAFPGRIINIHPALLPRYGGKGMFGMHVHQAVLDNHDTETGATVHFVDEAYDHGAIIAQERVPVLPGDTAESLAARVLEAEHRLLPRVVAALAARTNPTTDVSTAPESNATRKSNIA